MNSEVEVRQFFAKTLVPAGVKYTLVLAAVAKRMLATDIPSDFRLEFLQHLEKMLDTFITREMIAAVEPLNDQGYELYREAGKVEPKKRLDMYAEIFTPLAVLNPSLIAAIRVSPLHVT